LNRLLEFTFAFLNKLHLEFEKEAENKATTLLDIWKSKELEQHRNIIIKAAADSAQGMLAEWKLEVEKGLRKDAVTRSMGVNFGKITEHLIPFSVHLQEFDPRDIRFIGSPVDLMIFDGATRKSDSIEIYFVEIKTGSGQLSKKQKTIRDAIENNKVHWKPITVPEFKWDVPDEDEGEPTS
jgi:predicted Holliday junction resolvase-like endonuclease